MAWRQIVVALLAALAVGSVHAQQGGPARVVLAPVTEEVLRQSAEMVGVLEFDRTSAVVAEVSGVIDRLHVTEGQMLRAGDPIIRLNNDFLEKDIAIKRLELDRLNVELEKEELDLGRLQTLIKTEATSQLTYESALYGHNAKQKQRDIAQQSLERLELELKKSVLRAPFPGVVLEVMKDVGEFTGPQTPVVRIAATSEVLVKVAVSENVLRYLNNGERVDVTIDALDLSLAGTIRGVIPVADLRSKSAILQVAIPYGDHMVENMSARVQVPVSDKRTLRVLKRDALVSMNGRDFVYTVKEGKAALVPVNIVSRLAGNIAVDNPQVQAGMQVVVDGNDRLRPDQPVVVIGKGDS